jgi:hypothetical protein
MSNNIFNIIDFYALIDSAVKLYPTNAQIFSHTILYLTHVCNMFRSIVDHLQGETHVQNMY